MKATDTLDKFIDSVTPAELTVLSMDGIVILDRATASTS